MGSSKRTSHADDPEGPSARPCLVVAGPRAGVAIWFAVMPLPGRERLLKTSSDPLRAQASSETRHEVGAAVGAAIGDAAGGGGPTGRTDDGGGSDGGGDAIKLHSPTPARPSAGDTSCSLVLA